jgi:hypothetical protein
MGAPPLRDVRRTRALGDEISAKKLTGQLGAFDTGPDEGGEEASTLYVQLKAYDFAEGAVNGISVANDQDPFGGVVSSVLPEGILQSLEVIANLQWGHDGVTEQVVLNLCAAQILKAGLAGSYSRATAQLTAKYYQRFVGAVIAGIHATFFYLDPDPNIRNNFFNSIASPVLNPFLGFDPGTIPQTPIKITGIHEMGYPAIPQGGSFDRSARMTRRFFGTFPPVATAYPAGGALVFCPIAFGAGAVMLQCNPTDFINPATGNVASTLLMGMIDHAGNVTAQLVPNTFFPLIADCQQIFVYNPSANGIENPFTLIYDLGL